MARLTVHAAALTLQMHNVDDAKFSILAGCKSTFFNIVFVFFNLFFLLLLARPHKRMSLLLCFRDLSYSRCNIAFSGWVYYYYSKSEELIIKKQKGVNGNERIYSSRITNHAATATL